MNEQTISRRAALRGLGTISIGLPFLEEMCVSKVILPLLRTLSL